MYEIEMIDSQNSTFPLITGFQEIARENQGEFEFGMWGLYF